MLKKIAYIELDVHPEIARQFYLLMENNINKDFLFFVSYNIIKINRWENLENVICVNQENILDKISNYDIDFVVIGTLHRYFSLYYKITINYKHAIILHNLNFSFISNFSLIPKLLKENLIYHLKLICKEGLFIKNKILNNSDKLWVLDDNLLKYSKNFKNNKIEYLPLFFSENIISNQDKILRIVIPGRVTQKRRNYKKVFEEIKNYHSEKSINIVFLGRAEAPELQIIEKLSSKNNKINITYFREMISQPEFDFLMQNASFLYCPIKEKTTFMGVTENYGFSKISGNIGDCIKYSKIGFFPKFYPFNEDFVINEDSIFNMNYNNIKSYNFKEKYSKTKIQSEFDKIINNL